MVSITLRSVKGSPLTHAEMDGNFSALKSGVEELAGGVVVVATRTDLKSIDTSINTVAFLLEAYRAGLFIFSLGDYSSEVAADTQEGIYIAADGIATTTGAWVRQFSGLPLIDWFGAIPDDSTPAEAAVNAAIALCRMVTAYGDYAFEGPINLTTYGQGVFAPNAKFTNTGSSSYLFNVNGWRSGRISLRRLDIDVGASHAFSVAGVFRSSEVYVGEIYIWEETASYIFGQTNGKAYGNTIYIPYAKTKSAYNSPQTAAPIIDWIVSGISFVTNRILCDYIYGGNTSPAIRIENTGSGTFNTGNLIEVRTGEICDAGIVHLAGMTRTKVVAFSYDNGTTVDDLVKLYSSGSGNRCLGIELEFGRQSGTLGGSVYDISLDNAYDTKIRYVPFNSGVTAVIDNNNMFGTIIEDSSTWPATVLNEGTRVAWRTTRMTDARPGSTITIASGVATLNEATANNIWRKLDTEAAGATDDLTSISGGFVGQVARFSLVSSARTVVFKDGASIILEGGTDKTLSHVDDFIQLICTSSGVWKQIGFTDSS